MSSSSVGLCAFLLALAFSGCGRGDKRTGEACSRDRDCARGLCVANGQDNTQTCTHSCGSEAECPEGWSCSGVTSSNVLVCMRGAATPFGH